MDVTPLSRLLIDCARRGALLLGYAAFDEQRDTAGGAEVVESA